MTTWVSMGHDYAYTDVSVTTLSDAVDMIGYSIVRIEMPSAWTAASLTFQVSADNVTFVNAYLDGAEYTKTVSTSQGIGFVPADAMLFQRYIKIRSGTADTPVTQTAARTLRIVGVKIID